MPVLGANIVRCGFPPLWCVPVWRCRAMRRRGLASRAISLPCDSWLCLGLGFRLRFLGCFQRNRFRHIRLLLFFLYLFFVQRSGRPVLFCGTSFRRLVGGRADFR